MLFVDIPLLWKFLELVVKDWEQAVVPKQNAIDSASNDNEREFYSLQGFSALQPYYLKCLFSYVFFFIALNNAYDKFHAELRGLSNPSLRVKCIKKPTPTSYIEKVKKIRDISIAHIISEEENNPLNVEASLIWQSMIFSRKNNEAGDLNKMIFGGFKVVLHDSEGNIIGQSCDLEIKGIYEMDIQCREYLNRYDNICAEYLTSIQAKLPITINDEQYIINPY